MIGAGNHHAVTIGGKEAQQLREGGAALLVQPADAAQVQMHAGEAAGRVAHALEFERCGVPSKRAGELEIARRARTQLGRQPRHVLLRCAIAGRVRRTTCLKVARRAARNASIRRAPRNRSNNISHNSGLAASGRPGSSDAIQQVRRRRLPDRPRTARRLPEPEASVWESAGDGSAAARVPSHVTRRTAGQGRDDDA